MVSNREFMRKSFYIAAIVLLAVFNVTAQKKDAGKTAATAAVLPSDFSGWHKGPGHKQAAQANAKILSEYGLKSTEADSYQRGDRQILVNAYTFTDATGAYGFFTYTKTPSMAPEKFCEAGASDGTHVIFYCTNIFVEVQLDKVTAMTPAELRELAADIPRVTGNLAELPKLMLHLSPAAQKNAKYVAGPQSLDALNETVKSSLVDFSLSPEVVVAKEAAADGVATVTLVQYPTNKIAQAQVAKMIEWARANKPKAAPGESSAAATDAVVDRFATRRSGPLVGIVTGKITEGDARKILEDINYDAEVTWNEAAPTQKDNIGNLIYNIMLLAFMISGFMIVLGIAFGGFRVAMNRFFPGRVVNRPEDVDFIKLNLRD
jgi:hypothetical protein